MSTPHNRANPGDFAKTVLMPGDPCAPNLLPKPFGNPRLVTDVRGMLGLYRYLPGPPVSVMGSGMACCPSASPSKSRTAVVWGREHHPHWLCRFLYRKSQGL